ncbi:MAG: carbohydrate ABC transporter permease, partial [Mesorhizobium sp.]
MDQNSLHRVGNKALRIVHGIGLFLAMLVICLPGIWIVLSSLRPT